MSGSVNALIPMQAGHPTTPPPTMEGMLGAIGTGQELGMGPAKATEEVQKMKSNELALQAQKQKLQQNALAMQGQQAIRSVFAEPGALDPKTGMPTTEAMTKLTQIDPPMALKMQQNLQTITNQKMAAHIQKYNFSDKVMDDYRQLNTDAMRAYDRAMEGSHDPKQAEAAGQAVYSEGYDRLSSGGEATPDQIKGIPRTWNKNTAPLTDQYFTQQAAAKREAEAAKRADETPARAAEKDAETIANANIAQAEKEGGAPLDQAAKAEIRQAARNQAAVGKKAALGDVGLIDDEAANLAADRVLAGDERATTGMARSAGNITKVTNAIVKRAKEQGLGGADIARRVAEFSGTMAGERTLGVRGANMEIAANEVKNMAPLALQASAKVNRTQYPSLNSILIAAEKGTGDENIVQFGLAANSLIYTYSKFLNPTGIPTDADKARATEILSTAWSKGQFAAAIDQIKKEIASGQAAVKTTKVGIGEGLSGPSRESGAQPAPGATAGGEPPPDKIATPSSAAEYDALPPGATFRKPGDSRLWKKPGAAPAATQ